MSTRDISISSELEEIKINSKGDVILVDGNDAGLFDRYVKVAKEIIKLAEEMSNVAMQVDSEMSVTGDALDDFEKVARFSDAHYDFSKECTRLMDELFGDGFTNRYFVEWFDKIPNFVPNANLFMRMLSVLTPIMNDIFGKSLDLNIDKEKLRKYAPQDFKKSTKK